MLLWPMRFIFTDHAGIAVPSLGKTNFHLGSLNQEYCQPAVMLVKFPPILAIAPLLTLNLNDWCWSIGIAMVPPRRELRARSLFTTPFRTVLPPDQKLESKDIHILGRR